MRAAVTFLISSLVFGSLAVDYQKIVNQNSLLPSANSPDMISLRPKSQRNLPEGAKPVRGSGRRNLIESQGNSLVNM
ncbi:MULTISPECIES: heterocyst-inhibiting protein PatX [unclassified Anabaena]|uniref:heterocyst-inhibiting protein PatX n=1 Tax=unclassified Anabaena TaxID=2619674 RepID=UPI00082A6649|nr:MULTISPECIES: hypothetical protein [unclassified Anabaena]